MTILQALDYWMSGWDGVRYVGSNMQGMQVKIVRSRMFICEGNNLFIDVLMGILSPQIIQMIVLLQLHAYYPLFVK